MSVEFPITPVSVVSIERIKRTAKAIKREKGIPHHQALDESAVRYGFRNFSHAQNRSASFIPKLKVQPSHIAYISASWNGIGGGSTQRGTFAIKLELSAKLSDLVQPKLLLNHRALARFSLRGDNHLEHSVTVKNGLDPVSDAQAYICGAARAILFIDATRLKPSLASTAKLDTLPGKDHQSAWYLPELKSHFFVDEPYEDAVKSHFPEREAWARANEFCIEKSDWDGMYNPGGGARLFLVGSSHHAEAIKQMNSRLSLLPQGVVFENWGNWPDGRVQVMTAAEIRSNLKITRTDVINVLRPNSPASLGKTVQVNHLMFAGEIKRPNEKMPIEAHAQVGRLLKDVMALTTKRAGVYNRLNKSRSTLDDWAQLEYDSNELPDEKFFDLYYHEGPSENRSRISAEEGAELEHKLTSASRILQQHYPDCKPLKDLLKNITAAIGSLRQWSGYLPNNTIASASENAAYGEGSDAYADGMLLSENTYPKGSLEFEMWALGWQETADADFEDEMNSD